MMEGNPEIQTKIAADDTPQIKVDCICSNRPMGDNWWKQTQMEVVKVGAE